MKSVMAVLKAKQKEVEAIEAQLAKMLDELRVSLSLFPNLFLQKGHGRQKFICASVFRH